MVICDGLELAMIYEVYEFLVASQTPHNHI
jgi:hypothetical protein